MVLTPLAKSAGLHALICVLIVISLVWKNSRSPTQPPLTIDFQLVSLAPKKAAQTSPQNTLPQKGYHPHFLPLKSENKSADQTNGQVVSQSLPHATSAEGQANNGRDLYLAALIQLISAHQIYPQSSILNEEEGIVQLKLTLSAQGEIQNCEVLKSSGFKRLDEAAVKSLLSMHSLPLPEPDSKGVTLVVPLRYQLKSIN